VNVGATGEWSVDSWKSRARAQEIPYPDAAGIERAVAALRGLPPLVTSWEIERLKVLLAEAQEGRRFVLQGGDCAETLADCRPALVTSKLKILLQMSLVLVHGLKKPVVRIGRFAGQYSKPRSSATETRVVGDGEAWGEPTAGGAPAPPMPQAASGRGRDARPTATGAASGLAVAPNGTLTLPSYFGDLVNRVEFSAEARRPDPWLMVRGYQHAAMTLNFVRALVDGGFADLHHPEYWDLSFFRSAALPEELRSEYQRMSAGLADGLKFMEAMAERRVEDAGRVDFYTSHEGLNLHYESAQTRTVPRRTGYYDLTAHLPWIGDRTRQVDGAHVEFFRGVRNPVGVKLGPGAEPGDAAALAERLNPDDERGKLVFITRLGAGGVAERLPRLIEAVRGRRVLWVCDPMHGNTVLTAGGVKTRSFEAIRRELEETIRVHEDAGSRLGGVHVELTGEDVTECLGGAAGVTEEGLSRKYDSACDPRLNYQQSLELAFVLARRMAGAGRP
jgi:3-deoxy-7-phosphoheptulonate synthase